MTTAGTVTVEAALAAVLAGVEPLGETDAVALIDAADRVLADPLAARLTQPPFDASAMDGYAVRRRDIAQLPVALRVIGESAAGRGFAGRVGAGEAVRIFTGAPIPDQADAIVIQENTRRDGATVMVVDGSPDADHIRPRGGDFASGQVLLDRGRRLTPRDITLAAAMGHATLPVRRRPIVALLATGDELVLPGTAPGPDQIVCSNPFGVSALLRQAGAETRFLGIARDTKASVEAHVRAAAGADIIVTLGGASVGDHDLVAPVLGDLGTELAFWKIAMRPGKPMMFGRLGTQRVLGLPGNPVSSLITARLFAVPLVRALLGLPAEPAAVRSARTAVALEANGPRTHYMRATARRTADGDLEVTPVRSQDSSLLTPLAAADVLIVRPIRGAEIPPGGHVPILPLDM